MGKRRTTAPAPDLEQEFDDRVRRVASFLALCRDGEEVERLTIEEFNVKKSEARALVKSARAFLALAADVDVRAELGLRKEQLEDLLARTRDAGELKIELDTIRELSKLARVYDAATVVNVAESAEAVNVALARGHLEALEVCPRGLPIEELARLVAEAFAGAVVNGSKTIRGKERKSAKRVRASKS